MNITVTERGHRELSTAEWLAIQQSQAFWRLVAGNVVAVTALPGGRMRLDGSNLVGRALCDDVVIECQEKIAGALVALLALGAKAFRTRPVPAPTTELGPMIALLVRAFVDEVRQYVSSGREWRYKSLRHVSSLVGGRLHVPTTIQLHARGMRHLAAFDRQEIDHATEMNRLLYAALRETEALALLAPIDLKSMSDARAMSLFFQDCRDPEVLFGSSAVLASAVESLREGPLDDDHDQMLALAGVLLSHNSFEATESVPGTVPFSWFLNLENLFERAVQRRLTAVVASDIPVGKGAPGNARVFPATGMLIAHPDLVLGTAPMPTVGDVKYKDWSGTADASDLYQLLVHASTFGANRSFLVFPSDQYQEVSLGQAVTGADTWLFAVDVRDLDSGLAAACDAMGVPTK